MSPTPLRKRPIGALLLVPGLFVAAVPTMTMVALSFASDRFPSLPWPGWSLRWYAALLDNGELQWSILRSMVVGGGVAALSVVLGFPAGYALARRPLRSAKGILILWTLPVFVPFLLFGLSFFQLGKFLGVSRTLVGVILAHTVLFCPVVVALAFHKCRQLDPRLEAAGRELGASSFRVLTTIVGRQVWRTIIASAGIVFLLSWDEYVVAWFMAGFAKTYPVHIRNLLESTLSPEILAAGVLVALGSWAAVMGSWRLLRQG